MGHGHAHGPALGEGADGANGNERAVMWAGFLTAGFMVVELAGGIIANSLTLIADALHMATDAMALGLAWWAFRQARRAATPELSYGRDRMPVLVAFANAVVLVLLTAWIVYEAVGRLLAPEEVKAIPMLLVGWVGLLVNVAAFFILSGGNRDNLNVRAAVLHVLSDLLGSVAAIAAGAIILFTGWTPADPLLSLVVSALILRTTWRLISDSSHVLLEGAPRGATGREVAADLQNTVPGVIRVHHVHVWSISEERLVATLHADVARGSDDRAIREAIRRRLTDRFSVAHATIEIDEVRPEEAARRNARPALPREP